MCSMPKFESLGFAGVRLAENQHFARRFFSGERMARNFECSVFRSVVDHDDAQIGIVRIQRGAHRALDYFFFVISGNQHRDFWLVGSDFRRLAEDLLAYSVVDGGRADEKQASGHQKISDEEDPRDGDDGGIEHPEAQAIKARRPEFAASARAPSRPPFACRAGRIHWRFRIREPVCRR